MSAPTSRQPHLSAGPAHLFTFLAAASPAMPPPIARQISTYPIAGGSPRLIRNQSKRGQP
jgi:hypothetical protein